MGGTMTAGSLEIDLFVSHASEDKSTLVRPLAQYLADQGVNVWYDEFSLTVGDSLSRSIDAGLAKAKYGLVVLSKKFIEKPWPEYELRGLVSREIAARGKVILPVWFGVSHDEVLSFSPPLADKKAVVADGKSLEEVAFEILQAIRPDIAGRLDVFNKLRAPSGQSELMALDSLKMAPARPLTIDGHSIVRVHILKQVLEDAGGDPMGSVREFLENLSRDLHPEVELRVWEVLAAAYLGTVRRFELDSDKRKKLLEFLLALSLKANRAAVSLAEVIGSEVANRALTVYKHVAGLSAKGMVVIPFEESTRDD
ncbi:MULTISPECIES: TIR domain-containing protein [unclassified Blastococcus]